MVALSIIAFFNITETPRTDHQDKVTKILRASLEKNQSLVNKKRSAG